MKPDYLKPLPTDSEADFILLDILPDYKAEIRRKAPFHGREVDFNLLPIVKRADYLRNREKSRKGESLTEMPKTNE